jgi:hypothetical protein
MLRKLQLLVMMLAVSLVSFAQISEDFESYNAGEQLVEQAVGQGLDYWTTWSNDPGGTEDPEVSSEFAQSGSNSVVIQGTNDAVLLLGDQTAGVFNISFSFLVPTGNIGYFNVLQAFAGTNSEWGMQCFLDNFGTASVDAGGEGAATFFYNYDTWTEVEFLIDLDTDFAEMFVEGTSVVTWQWSGGSFGTGTLNQLGAINLFAWADNGTPKAFFDDIHFEAVATVEVMEDFESYNSGGKLVEQALAAGLDYWTCWSGDTGAGGTEDGTVSSEQAFSGSNSVLCDGVNDFVMLFDDKTAGKYMVEFYMYVPTGFVGYYNILQAWAPGGTGAVWGLEVYYNPDGIAEVTAANTTPYATFNYPYDSWFKMENIIDLNNDQATLLIDGTEVATWQWSLGASGGGINQLAAMDIYAAATNGTPKFFMDEIQFIQLEPPVGDPEITVSPNSFTFNVEYPSSAAQNMTIGNVGVVNLDYAVSVIYTDALDGFSASKVMEGEIVDSFGNESKVDAGSAPEGTDAIECPAGSLISQPAVSFASAYSADAENNYSAFQSFTGGGYISALRFWVVDYFFDGTAWVGCDGGDPRTFNIGFYADNGGKPGVEIMMEQITATRVATGEFFSGIDPIYEYTVELSSPVLVPEGWFSIQGISTTSDCWTLLINQPGGAGSCMQFNGVAFSAQDEPLGFCIVGEPYETWLNFLPSMGEVGPGESESVIVQCVTANLENPSGTDVYNATIIVNSNDPATPAYEVPVTLNLSGGVVLDPPINLTAELSGANDVLLNWFAPGPPPEPFFEGFEGGTLPTGWLAIDNDNDGFNWINTIEQGFGFEAYEGQGAMTSASFDNTAGPLNPDNYLITPPIEVGAGSMLTYYHTAQDPLYPNDFYYVKLSTTGNSIGDFTEVLWSGVTPLDWEQVSIDLSAYAGNTVYLAFHHTECTDWFWMKIDNVAVSATQTVAQYTPPITAPEISGFPFRTSGMTPTEIQEKEDFYYANLGGKELLGYNVYRDGDVIDQNVIETTYTDTDLTAGNTYTYYVTAVYDEGESGPSNEVSIEIPVGINEIHEKSFTMYPNPANGILYINSDSELISVKMINYTGQTVFNTVASGNEVKINSDNFAAGVYVIQVETISGITSQKLIIE